MLNALPAATRAWLCRVKPHTLATPRASGSGRASSAPTGPCPQTTRSTRTTTRVSLASPTRNGTMPLLAVWMWAACWPALTLGLKMSLLLTLTGATCRSGWAAAATALRTRTSSRLCSSGLTALPLMWRRSTRAARRAWIACGPSCWRPLSPTMRAATRTACPCTTSRGPTVARGTIRRAIWCALTSV